VSVELRAPRREDAPAIVEMMQAFGRAFDSDSESRADLESWFDNPGFDVGNDARIAVRGAAVVGYADVSDAARDGRFIYADLRLDPAHLEVHAPLLDFVEERGTELAAHDGVIKAWAPESAADLRSSLERRGYAFQNFSFRMLASLEEDPRVPEWPAGGGVRTFRPDDEKMVYEVHQEAFSEEPDFFRDPFDEWQHWSYREPFDPQLWFIAEDDGNAAGISLCRPVRDGDPKKGWVSVLGVRKPWRRRGLGLALLRHSFRELRIRGKTRVGLGVDGDNANAVALYEKAGMLRDRTSVWYERLL
jgi:mycothiol synthase